MFRELIMKLRVISSLVVLVLFLLSACGGSGSSTDTTAPAQPVISTSSLTTSDTTPTITGTAEADSTVTLYDSDGTTSLGTATATSGSWSITSSTISVAAHTLTAKATDSANNVSVASTSITLTVGNSGQLDSSFSGDGVLLKDLSGTEFGYDSLIDSNGKIVVAGLSDASGNNDFAILRIGDDGVFDTAFDTDGVVTTDFGASGAEIAYAIAADSNDKIVVAGQSTGTYFTIARYNTSGSLDTTFDTDGLLISTDARTNSYIRDIAVDANDKIIAGGYTDRNFITNTATTENFLVVRYNTDGSLDTSFDTDGIVTTSLGGVEQLNALVIDTDGKIVVAGYSDAGGNKDFVVARYNTDGSLDTSFDTDGIVVTDLGGIDLISDLVLDADGKIVVAGYSDAGGNNDFVVARYNTDGSLDTSFDTDGIVTTDWGGNDAPFSISIDSNGKIVAIGASNVNGGWDFAVARYLQ